MLEMHVHPSRAPAPATHVILGRGAVRALPDLLDGGRALLVIDEAVASTAWAAAVRRLVADAGGTLHEERIAAREDHKDLAACERLWSAWIRAGAGRADTCLAMGGGLTSDVAGFASACFHRGIEWIILPTTTLAMADAALGGKTAVNATEGKNLIGAVHHPRAVLADLDALATLPGSATAEGFAEVIKAAAVDDAGLLGLVEKRAALLRAGDAEAMAEPLFRALAVKARIVEADAGEMSRRSILNFGHTAAHALEHASGHAVSHGRAVAAGLVAEALLAERIGRLPAGSARRLATACDSVGVPWRVTRMPPREELVAAMRRDKKVRAGSVRVALPDGLGSHGNDPTVPADPEELADLLGASP